LRRLLSNVPRWYVPLFTVAASSTAIFSLTFILRPALWPGNAHVEYPRRKYPCYSFLKGEIEHYQNVTELCLQVPFQVLFVSELMYLPTVMVIKVTFFLFFERIFSPNKTMKWLIRGGIFAVVAFYIAIFFRSVFLCKPVALAWNPTLTGSCLKLEVTPYTTAVFNIISDIYILLLPMPLIWNLNLKTQRKMRLIAVFGMGIL
jgi:hypothetical protein